ncbi:hypothetical protein ACK3ZF_20160 [Aeromonas caviae]
MSHPHTSKYSSIFSTVYDEIEPIGRIGRGCHYSVLRAITSYDSKLNLTRVVNVHDFAVIWDEDHDTRVIEVIERMCTENLLSPVVFIGERKGGLTVLVDKQFYDDKNKLKYYNAMIRDICSSLDDPWCYDVGYFDDSIFDVTDNARMLINDTEGKVKAYILNIYGLWTLGVKEYNR